MLLITVTPGEEVMESLSRQLAAGGVTDGAIVSLIGAADSCGISNMAKDDPGNNMFTGLYQPMELTGTGEIKAGKVHIHCTASVEGGTTLGGHLHWASVKSHFVNAYILPLENKTPAPPQRAAVAHGETTRRLTALQRSSGLQRATALG